MFKRIRIALGLTCLAIALTQAGAAEALEPSVMGAEYSVTYLGNEGFMVQKGRWRIMFDALHAPYSSSYMAPTVEAIGMIMDQKPPFDGALVLFISHHHPDHFDPVLVYQLLRTNTEAVVVSTPQVIEKVRAQGATAEPLSDRLVTIDLKPGESRQMEINEFAFTAFSTNHSTYLEDDPATGARRNRHASVQHLVFQLEVDGTRIIHTGDLDLIGPNRDFFEKMNFERQGTDLAFLHVRFLIAEREEQLISQNFRSGKIIIMHIAPDSLAGIKKLRDDVLPGADILGQPLDDITLK